MQILGKFCADVRVQKRRVTSRPMVRFSQTWYQKMRKTWKKKVMKKRVAICGGREAVADFVQGGGQIDPPQGELSVGLLPLGLILSSSNSMWSNFILSTTSSSTNHFV